MISFLLKKHICVSVHINFVWRERRLNGVNNGYLWEEEMWVTFFFTLICISHIFYNESMPCYILKSKS